MRSALRQVLRSGRREWALPVAACATGAICSCDRQGQRGGWRVECEAAQITEANIAEVAQKSEKKIEASNGRRSPSGPFIPTDQYSTMEIEGWRVYVSPVLLASPLGEADKEKQRLGREAVRLLQWQLYHITRLVGESALQDLREVPIWLEGEVQHGAAEYHWSEQWLRENGYNPEKARSVEICNSTNFLQWGSDDLPTMLLHELAHAYHDRVLGADHKAIEEAFDVAASSGLYDTVLRISGHEERHYAMTNKFEFFACLTVCYFSVNDWFPFVRSEFKKHDPGSYAMMETIWGPRRKGLQFEREDNNSGVANLVQALLR